jgi:cysteinyl-tRNA synthetase
LKDLAKAFNDKTKVLILNSPSNPSGEVLEKADLQQIAEVVRKFPKVIVVTDDIYNRLVFDGKKLAPHLLQALKKGGNILNVLLGDIFGLLKGGDDESLSADAQKVLDERAAARQNKDFKRSDELRDKLKEMGIIVEDKKEGQRWRRA